MPGPYTQRRKILRLYIITGSLLNGKPIVGGITQINTGIH